MGAAFVVGHREGYAESACPGIGVACIGSGRESDGLRISIAKIPYPLVDKPGGRSA